jgi:hypothetical protein
MDEYLLNLSGIESLHQKTNSRLRFWFNHIRKNALKKDGDIFEFGVFQGASLIAAALILKELGSKKKVYGFDTFNGFPSYSHYDDLNNFYKYQNTFFDPNFVKKFEIFKKNKKILNNLKNLSIKSIGSSGNFEKTSLKLIKQKIKFFKLDNIKIIKGPFSRTLKKFFKDYNGKISSANLDCDLYEGYKICLPLIYKYLSKKGYINLDEYYSFKYPGAKIACDKFFKIKNIKPKKNKVRIGEFERWYFTK